MKKLGYAVIFAVGATLAGTANLQLTIGAFLMTLSYLEFRKSGIDISQIDDILLDKIKELISKGTTNEQK